MAKYLKTCHNPLHKNWTEHLKNTEILNKIINLRAHSLGDVLTQYKSLVKDSAGRPKHITNSCCYCLSLCLIKEDFKTKICQDLQLPLHDKVRYKFENLSCTNCMDTNEGAVWGMAPR